MTKRIASYLCHIVLLLIIFSTLFLIITIKINAVEAENIQPYFDPLVYKGMSADELQTELGAPDLVERWDYEVAPSENGVSRICKMVSYYYGTKEFMYVEENDAPKTLVRIRIKDKIPYEEKTLLALFSVNDEYTNSRHVESSPSAYRVFNVGRDSSGIYDFWVKSRDTHYLYELNLTFYNGLFTDDEI